MSKKKPAKKKKTAKKRTKQGASNSAPVESLPSLQSMEGLLAGLGGTGRGRRSAVDEAQEIMYDAWEAPTRQRAVALAKKALEVSPDCADAYNLLAEETAKSLEEVLDLYRKGVEAGERALGKKTFKEDVGHFWGLLETRPYMRARAGLAQSLWEAGQREEAVEHYWDLLRLNPNDNQGIRDLLMPCLIELGRELPPFPEEARTEANKVHGCVSQVWIVTSADNPGTPEAVLHFIGDSDAVIVRGLIAILISLSHIP